MECKSRLKLAEHSSQPPGIAGRERLLEAQDADAARPPGREQGRRHLLRRLQAPRRPIRQPGPPLRPGHAGIPQVNTGIPKLKRFVLGVVTGHGDAPL